jgi:hypothetical protein
VLSAPNGGAKGLQLRHTTPIPDLVLQDGRGHDGCPAQNVTDLSFRIQGTTTAHHGHDRHIGQSEAMLGKEGAHGASQPKRPDGRD